ncbi:hypothetical protein QO200_05070 [Flavobacterium sp. Arc3]|jgi:hypothetical protein|uniref:hypothetical protein n=1 Tax=Flavobacterium sp. Arc3 TaxID=3046686 RepID=UPI00352D16D6
MKKIKLVIGFTLFLAMASCALQPIASEYTFIKTDLAKVELDKLGDGNILIYNGATLMHKLDNTARLNIWIDNKALGQIRPTEYVIINVKKGQHHFKVVHVDVVNMKSEHDVNIDTDTKVIKIKPTVTSNKLEVTNEFPSNFEKLKYAQKR